MEHEPLVENVNEIQKRIDMWIEDDEPSQVEDYFLHREFPYTRLLDEKNIFAWLKGRAENKLGRKLLVKLSKEGLIVPIEDKLEEIAEEE